MNKFITLMLIVIVIFSVTDASAKKKLYKWVDENGNVTYSDQVPPDQIKKKHEELNEQGIVLDKIGNARTAEEIKADKLEKRRQKEAEILAQKKEKQRQNIIKSYTNEAEIIRLKNERLSALKRNIELASQSLAFQKISRDQLMSMAADHERSGKNISKALKTRIKVVEKKIKYQIEFITVKEKEIAKVKEKFSNDMVIYREATQGK